MITPPTWRSVASGQAGLITRVQLRELGVGRHTERQRIRSERWEQRAPGVISITTGELTQEQRLWLGALHAGGEAVVSGVHALVLAGLRGWERDETHVLVPYSAAVPEPLDGYAFIRTRRALRPLQSASSGVPRARVEPAALLWASRERSVRAAEGLLAAVVQQRLATAETLARCLNDLARLPRAPRFRALLADLAGGSQSVAEVDVVRMCRRLRIAPPARQVRRRDSSGRSRYTDAEWRLADGRTLVLEVDGGFHMDAASWEDDIVRERSLSAPDRFVLRCTSRELRDDDEVVGRDLIRLGVPRVA